ncbi:MAG: transporter permease [Citrobacter freundii]|nr:MAG: transporter permease [Citrobacter freundii]
MSVSNFKLAWRSLVKDRQFSILNLLGLASGLACALMIYLWIMDERKVDKYNANDARLYQVMQNIPHESGIETIEYTPGLLADALVKEMPEVESAATVVPPSWFGSNGIASIDEVKLKTNGQFISKGYFNTFSCTILKGDPNELFAGLQTIAISDEFAAKIFKNENPIGKTLDWNQDDFNGRYRIVAVFKKNPENATERFDLLLNYALFVDKRPSMKSWNSSDPSTYLVLKKNASVAQLDAKLKGYLKVKSKDAGSTLFLRKFSDKYLYGQYTGGLLSGGRIGYVKLFGFIAVFILVIACINFMNLSTARAVRRIKEIGIQKAMGASRSRIILQYLSESVLTSFFALALAMVLIAALMPAFNQITGKSLTLDLSPSVIVAAIAITFITGLVAGSYPALYISGFRPVAVLKGELKTSVAELWTRKGLVVFQFALSIFAIAAVLIIYRQISFIQSRDLGYKRDNIIHFEQPVSFDSVQLASAMSMMNELKNIPGVVNASSYYHNLTGNHGSIGNFQWPGKDPNKNIDFVNLEVGANFIETVGIRMKEGRAIKAAIGFPFKPSNEIVFNESAINAMGIKDPIGKTVKFWDQERVIVGVAEDFNFESLYAKVQPCFFQVFPVMPNIIVKIRAGSERQTIAQVQSIFEKFNKGLTFDYRFMDEEYQALYQSESRVAVLSKYFAGLAIIISCLGLFGLAAFTAQKRQKEIGIRKVVGASVQAVVFMLSKGFLQLILVAACIALPAVWWVMGEWLNGFAYRTSITMNVFVLTIGSILLITLVTISFQSVRAAMANPVKSLRSE